ncbi:MAG: universal stress protein [Candidatus Bathyarchaeia archaeon]|jgi:nucleotide-binding universal stress UspA family protein
MKKILVAIDGSENSDRALDFALEFAEKYGTNLTLLNVSEISAVTSVPSDITPYPQGGSMVVLEKDFRKIHQEILTKALERAKAVKPNMSVSSVLREGNPSSEIVALAKDEQFDVVVVGHRGSGKLKEMFMGNISERVAHQADCTVIIVK